VITLSIYAIYECAPSCPLSCLSGLWALLLLVTKGSGGWELKFDATASQSQTLVNPVRIKKNECYGISEQQYPHDILCGLLVHGTAKRMIHHKAVFLLPLFPEQQYPYDILCGLLVHSTAKRMIYHKTLFLLPFLVWACHVHFTKH
jgi:hypothetical protein